MPEFAAVVRSVRDDHEAGVLLIDHNMALVMEVCDRIQVLDQGRTLAEGTPAEIRANIDVTAAYLGEATPGGGRADGVDRARGAATVRSAPSPLRGCRSSVARARSSA